MSTETDVNPGCMSMFFIWLAVMLFWTEFERLIEVLSRIAEKL